MNNNVTSEFGFFMEGRLNGAVVLNYRQVIIGHYGSQKNRTIKKYKVNELPAPNELKLYEICW